MNTLLADPPALADTEQPPPETPGASPPPGVAPESSQPTAAAARRTCSNCGAPLDGAQDWCLQCGAGAPGSLDAGGPSWRSAATIIAATAILALGAAAAAYAALSREGASRSRPVTVKVAQAPAATAPSPTTPLTPAPTTPGTVTPTPKAANPLPSTGTAKPPKIPLSTPTPKSSSTTTTPSSKTEESGSTTTPSTGNESSGAKSEQPSPILLDTNAASTYNPYGYPASEFGDPSLTIDGEPSTAWTAQVNPAVAPKLAEGVAIDLKTAQKVSALTLITSTPGMTVQVYGSNGHTLPGSITDRAWTALSPSWDVKKRKTRDVKLRDSHRAFRFILLWISRAPTSAVGTAPNQAPPTHVAINELELFPTTG